MKLLYHHRTASRDGQEVHVRELIAALRGLGHEVAVVAPGGEADEGEGGGANEIAQRRALPQPLGKQRQKPGSGRLLHQGDERFERAEDQLIGPVGGESFLHGFTATVAVFA